MNKSKVSQNTFSVSEAIHFAWQIATKNLWFFVRIILVSQAISLLLSYASNSFQANGNTSIKFLGFLILIAGWVINTEISFARTVIYLKFVDKKKATVKDLFAYFNAQIIFRLFVITLLLACGTIIGFLLFIFPGIYFLTKYWFAPYIYVDKRTGIIASFKESAKLTKGVKRKIFLLGTTQMLIVLAGAMALLVGLFIAVPMNTLSDLYVYRKLSSKK